MNRPTVLDLFSGCGGMSWGLHKAGFDVIGGVDIWDQALETFKNNHPDATVIKQDISDVSPGDFEKLIPALKRSGVDCIVGGPPCQGFSKNVPATYRFLKDPRNQLFRRFLLYIDHFRPKFVVMENVAEIYNAYGGQVKEEIVTSLEGMGYSVNVKVINVAEYGIPQNRRRCFFLASNVLADPVFPNATHGDQEVLGLFGKISKYVSAWSAISDLPTLYNGEGFEPMPYQAEPMNEYQKVMRRDSLEIWDHITRNLKQKQYDRVNSLKPGQGLKELPLNLRPKSGYSGAYGRLDMEMVAPTITRWVFHPGSGRYCHPREPRLITIREAARIQSFSDEFRFSGSYIKKAWQVGNAVPPLMMFLIAEKIMESFRQDVSQACV